MQGRDGQNLIVVQGKVDDPANLWVHIDKKLAAAQLVQVSTSQIDSMRQKQEPRSAMPEKELETVMSR